MISTQFRSGKVNLIAMVIGMLQPFVSGMAQASIEAVAGDPGVFQLTLPSTGTTQLQLGNGIFELGSIGIGPLQITSAISADGRVLAGGSGSNVEQLHAFRWTEAGGTADLGTLGGTFSTARGISADGRVVVGYSSTSDAKLHAFRWTQAGGMIDLGSPDSSQSIASGVSADGSVVIGQSYIPNDLRFFAFRWTQAEGMIDLGTISGRNAFPWGVSADGTVVVGESSVGAKTHAFRWTKVGGMTDLGGFDGQDSSARGVSADGTVVVGNSYLYSLRFHAFRWTQATGMFDLGTLGGNYSNATAISADGHVIVGSATTSADMTSRGFRWTQSTGMQSIEDWLRSNGISVARDVTSSADATNRDGSVVVGQLENGQAYIARVSSAGNGLVTLAEVQNSLYAAAHGSVMAISFATTAINGAHSRPLSRWVASGQRAFWVAGDWGRDDHGARSGNLGLAEVGLGYNFGPVQVNVSLGQTWAQQRLALDGVAKADGTYLLTEALVPVATNLWATLSAYGNWGDANLRRAYLSGGVTDYSTARPAVQTWGLRTRLDWDNAIHVGGAEFSPYIDLTYSETKLDAYAETGGGFPARFDARKDRATDLRLGGNATYPLMGNLRLLGTLEAVHRFEKSGARATGEVIGMFGFDLDGTRNKQDWVRLSGGIEGPLAGGKAMLSINATTQGEAPNIWLAANWQLAF